MATKKSKATRGKKLRSAKKIGRVKPLTVGVDPLNPQPLPPYRHPV
ncbi:MAG TPA: hypothetical protein VEJ38_02950 [Candidatus Acidoferrales bacterium]|nr:hypothetical protein [Candidatus Acidoferrales bacterium]